MSGTILVPEYDHANKRVVIGHWQDVEDIVEKNKKLANGERRRNDWHEHIATIPNNILLAWWLEDTGGDPINYPILGDRYFNEYVSKRLEDPEWRNLRVDTGPGFCLGWRPK